MNKPRLVGLALIALGIIGKLSLQNDAVKFIMAIIIGFGIGMLITGRFTSGNANN